MKASKETDTLLAHYKRTKRVIKRRLEDFSKLRSASNLRIFEELCFCLLTPQSKALSCHAAIEDLKKSGLLLAGSEKRVKRKLKGRARFHNKKASFLVRARKMFQRGRVLDIKSKIDAADVIATRDWLVDHIKGFGYKEASHFLRNIGLGEDIAILDRHILKNLCAYGAINTMPASVGQRKSYLEIEDKVKKFARKMRISPAELDLLLWSFETGVVFK